MHGFRGGLGNGQQPHQPRNIELFEILIFFNGIKKPLNMLECISQFCQKFQVVLPDMVGHLPTL